MVSSAEVSTAYRNTIIVGKSPSIQRIIQKCPQARAPYQHSFWARNGFVETILMNFLRQVPNIEYERECLITKQNGIIGLDWELSRESKKLGEKSPLLVLVPGLGGNSSSSYIKHTARQAAESGIRVVVFNHKGSPELPVTVPEFYSASHTDDFRMGIKHISEKYPKAKLMAAGYSLGGNILIRYLSEEGSSSPITAAASLGNPFNLSATIDNMSKGVNVVVDRLFAMNLTKQLRSHLPVWRASQLVDVDKALQSKSMREFDSRVTAPCFGWGSADEYYSASGSDLCVGSVGGGEVEVPLLLVNAANDPLSMVESVPVGEDMGVLDEGFGGGGVGSGLGGRAKGGTVLKGKGFDCTAVVVTPKGGHIGWCTVDYGLKTGGWYVPLLTQFLQACVEEDSVGMAKTGGRRELVGANT